MVLIDLRDYILQPEKRGTGSGIGPCSLSLCQGHVYALRTDSANDAHLFFKGLATLAYPSRGSYRYMDRLLDFSDYRKLLETKKTIGYLTSETALISNRSIRENLNLGRAYFENDLSSQLDTETMDLCGDFGIDKVIDERPANLGAPDLKSAMMTREIAKKPKILLLEYPEEFCLSGGDTLEVFIRILKQRIQQGMALVFLTHEEDFSRCFSGTTLTISKGTVLERHGS